MTDESKDTITHLPTIRADSIVNLWKEYSKLENQVMLVDLYQSKGFNQKTLCNLSTFFLELMGIVDRCHSLFVTFSKVIDKYKQEYELSFKEDGEISFQVRTNPIKTAIPYIDGKLYIHDWFVTGWLNTEITDFALYQMAMRFYALILDGIAWAEAADISDSGENKDE